MKVVESIGRLLAPKLLTLMRRSKTKFLQLLSCGNPTHAPNLAYLMNDGAATIYYDVRSCDDRIKAVAV